MRLRIGLERQEPAELDRELSARPDLAQELGTKVAVGNDVDVATWAEFALGAGRGATRSSACSGEQAWEGADPRRQELGRARLGRRMATWWSGAVA